jgi:glycosyltransferase involved in cell wall biosynthesis
MTESDVNLVHAHWTYEFALSALKLNRPVVVTAHDWAPAILRFHRDPYRVARLVMQRMVLRRAEYVTTVSPYLQQQLAQLSSRDVDVIPNPVRLPEWKPRTQRHRPAVVGSALNGFTRRKNAESLLEGFALFRESHDGAELLMAGDGFEPGGPANRWAKSRGLAEAVTFLGPLPAVEIPEFMCSLDVFVSPSLEESFGMTLIEAIIEGTPVVGGSASGSVPWVLNFGEAGELVNVQDAESIAGGIARSLDMDESTRKARRDYVRQNFSLGHVVDQYEVKYCSVLAAWRR